jgi:hypothetical protein
LPDVLPRLLAEQEKFTAILGWHPALRSCSNASYYQLSAESRLPSDYQPTSNKKFGATFLTSSKAWCPGHILRQEVYNAIGSFQDFEIIKFKSNQQYKEQYVDKTDFISHYQFGIEAENSCIEGYFTEKLIDLCLAKVIPIYCGCPNIADYGFDTSGILTFSGTEDLDELLYRLTSDTYVSMMEIIDHNFRQAQAWNDRTLMDKEIDRILGLKPRKHEILHPYSLAPA